MFKLISQLFTEAKTVRKAVDILSRTLGVNPSLVSRMMGDLGPESGNELGLMIARTEGSATDPFRFIYECGALIFFFHWCLYKSAGDINWMHQHLAKQGFLIDQISTDTHALSIAQSILGGIELRGYDLRRFNQNLSVFMAEYEEYLDSDGTREPPKLVLH